MPINGLQDVNYNTILVGTNAPRVIDDAVRQVAEGTKKSFHEDAAHSRHYAAGDLKIPRNTVAALVAALASPSGGDLRFNASTGNLEIRIAADIVYTGTLSEDMPDNSTVVDSAADFLNQVAAFPTAAADRETDATISINSGPYEALWEVDSASQLTLAAAYSLGIQLSGVAYTVRLKTAGSWYPISDVLTAFIVEHYRTGEHKIVIQTDGSDPTNVRDNQPWVNWQNGVLDLRVRVAGTTRQLTTVATMPLPLLAKDGVTFPLTTNSNTHATVFSRQLFIPLGVSTLSVPIYLSVSGTTNPAATVYYRARIVGAATDTGTEQSAVYADGVVSKTSVITISTANLGTVVEFQAQLTDKNSVPNAIANLNITDGTYGATDANDQTLAARFE